MVISSVSRIALNPGEGALPEKLFAREVARPLAHALGAELSVLHNHWPFVPCAWEGIFSSDMSVNECATKEYIRSKVTNNCKRYSCSIVTEYHRKGRNAKDIQSMIRCAR